MKEYQSLIGSFLSIFFSVIIVQWILPFLTKRKRTAREKLDNFYNVAYSFVKIRENFSVNVDGGIHNKENCGFFHDVNYNGITGLIFNEMLFFNFVSERFQFIDSELRDCFTEYFKARTFESVQKNLGCGDSKLIRLRKEIEKKIVCDYEKYYKILK